MPGMDAPWHWVILAIIVIVLFGYKRLPDAARSLGRSLRIFKTEVRGMADDDVIRNVSPAHDVAPAPAEPVSPAPLAPVEAPPTFPDAHRVDGAA